jgi:Tol biopolymer transport system component
MAGNVSDPEGVVVTSVDIESGGVESITLSGRVDSSMVSLSPDGSTLAFSMFDPQSGQGSVWSQRLAGGPASQLAEPPTGASDFYPAWQPAPAPVTWPPFSVPAAAPTATP